MGRNKITIDVEPQLKMQDETGNRALKLVEWYINDSGKRIGYSSFADGSIQLYYIDNKGDSNDRR